MLFFVLAKTLKAKEDCHSFLFTLVNPDGSEPFKLNPNRGGGIQYLISSGPRFGTNEYSDLLVWDMGDSDLDLGHGFECPEAVDKELYFFGIAPFDIYELEVFRVNF